jgi:hypothetical protein
LYENSLLNWKVISLTFNKMRAENISAAAAAEEKGKIK